MYLRPRSKTFKNKRKLLKLLQLASTGKYSSPQLAKKYRCNSKTIRLVLGDNNIRLNNLGRFSKTISCDDRFFDKLNPVSSYWLGFIAADGCLSKTGKYLSLGLSAQDKVHLIKFKHLLKTNAKISFTASNNCVKIAIYNLYLFNRLEELGIFPNKSLSIEKVNVPESYMAHFVRGVFDGDGSISGKDTSHLQLCIAGNEPFLRWIQKYLQGKCSINKTKLYEIGKNNKAKRMQYTGSQILRILDLLYKDSIKETRLDRKYNKYLKLKKKYPQIDTLYGRKKP